jgi:hypothetical protein
LYPGIDESGVAVTLAQPDKEWPVMPAGFVGLSYESGQLYDPDFFSAGNGPLVQEFRQLNDKGVLRLGGHLSNITPWEGVGRTIRSRYAVFAMESRTTGSGHWSILQ